jgi:hypothetical protein
MNMYQSGFIEIVPKWKLIGKIKNIVERKEFTSLSGKKGLSIFYSNLLWFM